MVELAVADVAVSRAWYEATLGLRVVMSDAATGFLVFQDDRGGRVALKPGTPNPGGVVLHFEVADVESFLQERAVAAVGPVTASAEGYREAFVRDPDGYRVGVFAWDRSRAASRAPSGAG